MNGRDDVAAVGRDGGDAAFVGFNGRELRFFRREQSGANGGVVGCDGVAHELGSEDVRNGNDGGGFDDVRKIFFEFVSRVLRRRGARNRWWR